METKKYTLSDGGVITATNALEFVKQLQQSSKFDNEGTPEQYMARFAERYKDYSGITLNTSNPDAFVDGLIAHKYIESIE